MSTADDAAEAIERYRMTVMEQAMMYRAALLTSFAQVEWFTAELIEKFSRDPEYAGLNLDFTQNVEKRVEKVRAMLAIEGSRLAGYRDELEPLILDVVEYEDFRNFMAHGVLVISFPEADAHLLFRMYRMFKGGQLHSGELSMTIVEFGTTSVTISGICTRFISLVRRIWQEQNLPPAG